VTVFCQEDSNL